MKPDIFDLEDLSDVPEDIRNDLKILFRNNFEKEIIKLFKLANRRLRIDEVTVAYFRLYKKKEDRRVIMSKLYNMSRSKHAAIRSIAGKKGIYELVEDK